MDADGSYLRRKNDELDLIAACLAAPPDFGWATSLDDVIERKFRLAAALKAERALSEWAATETSWDGPSWRRAGAFEWRYEYQRADLAVRGPLIYRALAGEPHRVTATIHSSCGMSALTTLVLALERIAPAPELVVPHGAYGETLQVIENYTGIEVARLAGSSAARRSKPARKRPRALLVDSSVPESLVTQAALTGGGPFDLLIFDTTCLCAASGRIRSILTRADNAGVAVVLVRSHAKLDTLGIEYGRLGSAVFVAPRRAAPAACRLLDRLAQETRDAVRLLGAAPVPAHLPPFAGGARYEALNMRRAATLLRNGRRMVRRLRQAGVPVTTYQHGLYVLLRPAQDWDLEHAKGVAAQLSAHLRERALPVRHAGSFGFDFCVLDSFPDATGDRHLVRLAFPDLPLHLVDEVADAIAEWWLGHVIGDASGCARRAA